MISIVCEGPHQKGRAAAGNKNKTRRTLTRVVSFARGWPLATSDTEWMEMPVPNRRRPAVEVQPLNTGGSPELDDWLATLGTVKPSAATNLAGELRRPSAAEIQRLLTAGVSAEDAVRAYETQWTPSSALALFGRQMAATSSLASFDQPQHKSRAESRVVYSIKCPRCDDGRTRRAEKLWPLLNLIAEQTPVNTYPIGRFQRIRSRSRTLTIPQFWFIADEYDRRVNTGE